MNQYFLQFVEAVPTFGQDIIEAITEDVACEASKTTLHGVLMEFPFHTACHGIKYLIMTSLVA